MFAFYFDITHHIPTASYVTDHFYVSPLMFSPCLCVCVCVSLVVVSVHAPVHVGVRTCVRVHVCMPPVLPRRSRGGGPSPAQTNSSLSLKAMNSVQTGHRKQAGPAGKQDEEGIRKGG